MQFRNKHKSLTKAYVDLPSPRGLVHCQHLSFAVSSPDQTPRTSFPEDDEPLLSIKYACSSRILLHLVMLDLLLILFSD